MRRAKNSCKQQLKMALSHKKRYNFNLELLYNKTKASLVDLQASSLTEDTIDTECALSMTPITYSYAKFSDNCKNCKIMSSYWVIHMSQIREKYCHKLSLFLVTHYLVYQKHGRNYPKTIGCKFLNLKLQDMRKGTSQV